MGHPESVHTTFLAHLPVNIRLVMDESLNYCRMPSLRKKIQPAKRYKCQVTQWTHFSELTGKLVHSVYVHQLALLNREVGDISGM